MENKGTVAYLGKGFGFIKIAGRQKDLFFHAQKLSGITFDQLQVNDAVEFDSLEETDRGQAAIGVRLA